MIALKELLDDIGGKNLTVGAILLVVSWVASSRYISSIEERLKTDQATFAANTAERKEIRDEIAALRASQQIDEYERSTSRRFTISDGAVLEARLARLEKRMDGALDEDRKEFKARR